MKITSDIFLVGGPGNSDSSDAAIYLIISGGEAALVDAGTGNGAARVMKNIRAAGVDPRSIRYLFITHCHYDHTGGANRMRDETGCAIIAHELDAEFLEAGDAEVTAASWYGARMDPVRVDIKVTGRERLFTVGSLRLAFYHAPGHSPGSAVLTVESDGKLVLFGQDVHGPLNDALRSVREDYVNSLEFMLSLEADILCEGHFGVYAGKEKVRDFIESFL
ncbi:MAG: MBL fold metallo-hydrolase [Spirochaetes bacterium RBG_13_51_14]|nr:MAG: MBL fold metallo-hydrolase [Spirochaetes bacterium RBG_13_51_14]